MTANVKLVERLEEIHKVLHEAGYAGKPTLADSVTIARQAMSLLITDLRSPSPAQGTYSIEDIRGWLVSLRKYGMQAQPFAALEHPVYGIAAWKSKQLDAGGK